MLRWTPEISSTAVSSGVNSYGIDLTDSTDRYFSRNILTNSSTRYYTDENLHDKRIGGITYRPGIKIGYSCLSDVRRTVDGKHVIKRYARADEIFFQREIVLTGALSAFGIPAVPINAFDVSERILVKPFYPGTDASLEALVIHDENKQPRFLKPDTEQALLSQKSLLVRHLQFLFGATEFATKVRELCQSNGFRFTDQFLINDAAARHDSNLRFHFTENRIEVLVLDP